jgi:hypothetical protein
MAGLIGAGRSTLSQATGGFSNVAAFEAARNQSADNMKAARNAQRMSAVSTGAGIGASIGLKGVMAAKTAASAVPTVSAIAPTLAAAAAPTTAATTIGAAALPTATAALGTGTTVAAAPVAAAAASTGAAATGAMAAIGAIATPLLIGVGAALLLDSIFDIF